MGDAENDWLEVPAGGVFCLSDSNLTCFPFDGREEQCQTFGTTLFESVFISEGKY